MVLLFHKDALADIPPHDYERLIDKVEWLWANRKAITHHPLSHQHSGFYKRRLGKYRILYTYDEGEDDLTVRLVGTRDNIYKKNPQPLI